MNKLAFQGKLRQARGNVKMQVARLTDDDRSMLDGKIDQMVGLFQEKYGNTRARSVKALTHYLEEYGLRRHSRVAMPSQTWSLVAMSVGLAGIATAIAYTLFNHKTEEHDTTSEQVKSDEFFVYPETELK